MNIGFKLKEIQVTPGSFDSIMHAATWFPAFRARKFTAGFKIHMNIELPSFNTKIHRRDVPWIFKIQCYLEEGFM
jgi:hypothetical protein